MKQPTISCEHITKTFGTQNQSFSLHDVNFNAYEDELIMLMGPSGSGKTTLLSIIGGILKPTSGTCLVLGHNPATMNDHEKTDFRGKNIGFMFQNFNLVPTLTALENAAIPLLLHGYSNAQAYKKAGDVLSSLGITTQQDRKPAYLSGGEQQRVAIARGCILQPKIMLCDEPTSYLDSQRGKMVIEILQNIKSTNKSTLLVVTHDQRILHFADRIFTIEDGILKEAPKDQKYFI